MAHVRSALDDPYHDIVEFAQSYFNAHERSPEGTISLVSDLAVQIDSPLICVCVLNRNYYGHADAEKEIYGNYAEI